MSKHSYRNVEFFNQTVSADVQTMAIDCSLMDTASFVMSFPIGLACDITVEGSIDGTVYVDIGSVIESVDGVAVATRFANVFQNALSKIRVSLTNVVGSGDVVITAQAKGFS